MQISFQTICHPSSFTPIDLKSLTPDFLTIPTDLSGTPLYLPMNLAPSLLFTSILVLMPSISPWRSHSTFWLLCSLISLPPISFSFFFHLYPHNPRIAEPLPEISSFYLLTTIFYPSSALNYSHFKISRLHENLQSSVPTMFTTLTPDFLILLITWLRV